METSLHFGTNSCKYFPQGICNHSAKGFVYSARMVKNVREILSQNMRILMIERGLSATELGKRADISHKAIYLYLNQEKVPGIDKVEAIAKVLGVTPWQLLAPGMLDKKTGVLLDRYSKSTPEAQAFIDQILERETPKPS